MCGIAGALGVEPELARPLAPRWMSALRHRGPDDQGHVELACPPGPPVQLIHTRLAILDLTSAGAQPMRDHPADPSVPPNWIVFNGEIVNFQELRSELAAGGWPCRTRCDTEVILHAYRLWGEAAVERFEGMFAFVLVDQSRGSAWFCRDRLGIQPLYLYHRPLGGLLFASEVRAMLAAGAALVPPRFRRSALEAYLAQGSVYGDEALIEGVELLPPGHWMRTDLSGQPLERRRYWSSPRPAAEPIARPHAVDRLGQELRRCVKKWLVSDVPIGLFLSGGLDSGALATLISEDPSIRLRTVSIGFDDQHYDETDVAAAVAAELKTEHSVLKLHGEDVLHELPQAFASVDQPTIDGFNTFFVSREARKAGLTVALSGTGGDELFGGYPTFAYVPRTGRLQRLAGLAGPLHGTCAWMLRRLGRRGALRLSELLKRPTEAVHRYLLRWELFLPEERRRLHELPEASDPYSGIPRSLLDELRELRDPDPINLVSRLELRGFLGQVLLRDADISCLTHSIEVRPPLLDHRVVELVMSLPGRWKRPDPRIKPLLVDAVGARLPRVLLGKPKRGFSLPWKSWLHGPLAARAEQAMQHREIWLRLEFSPDYPLELWSRFRQGDRCVAATQILALMALADYVERHNLK